MPGEPDFADIALSWIDGCRAVQVSVTRDADRYRQILAAELGADRVVVATEPFSTDEQLAVQRRVVNDTEELRELGIEWKTASGGDIEFIARDRDAACELLRARYGRAINPIWIGPDRLAEQAQCFASWTSDGHELTVFYALPRNGEQPGHCVADEQPDRVVVRLTILVPRGVSTMVGGFTPSHTTITLNEPVGNRDVIDAATRESRPLWDTRGRPQPSP